MSGSDGRAEPWGAAAGDVARRLEAWRDRHRLGLDLQLEREGELGHGDREDLGDYRKTMLQRAVAVPRVVGRAMVGVLAAMVVSGMRRVMVRGRCVVRVVVVVLIPVVGRTPEVDQAGGRVDVVVAVVELVEERQQRRRPKQRERREERGDAPTPPARLAFSPRSAHVPPVRYSNLRRYTKRERAVAHGRPAARFGRLATMVATAHVLDSDPSHDEGQRLVLYNVSWQDYVAFSDALGNRAGIHLTYLEGTLEIMTPSPLHENQKKGIARLLELYALVRGVRLYGYGSTTYRREERQRGLEPDECYFIDSDKKDFPDLAVEVAMRGRGVDKLKVYEGLGVREVWIFRAGRFFVYELGAAGYEERSSSRFFPDIDFAVLAEHVLMPDQDAAVRAYWDLLRR